MPWPPSTVSIDHVLRAIQARTVEVNAAPPSETELLMLYARAGMPVLRLGSASNARRVAIEWNRLENSSVATLKAEHHDLGLLSTATPLTAQRDEITGHLKAVAVWLELSLHGLQEECRERGVPVESWLEAQSTEEDLADELVQRLLISCCEHEYEASGVPVRRLGSTTAARRLLEDFASLESFSLCELSVECVRLGVPVDAVTDRSELVHRLKDLLVWRELPQGQLQKECHRFGINSGTQEHEQVVRSLAAAVWATSSQQHKTNDSWISVKSPELARYIRTLGLPPSATITDAKHAFRVLALKYHPDKNPEASRDEAAQKFREVVEAYNGLCM